MMDKPLRLLVVDDQTLVREALAGLLDAEPEFTVVGQAADGSEVPALARDSDPDIVVMDVRMPDVDGVEATARLTRERPQAKVILLTTFDVDAYVYAGLRAGASGFLLKDSHAATLIAAVHTVASGNAVLSPWATSRLVSTFAPLLPEPLATPPRLKALTARERDVLSLTGRGLSNNEIAAELGIGYETVKSHLRSVMTKLRLRDRVIVAYETGLLRPSE